MFVSEVMVIASEQQTAASVEVKKRLTTKENKKIFSFSESDKQKSVIHGVPKEMACGW